MVEQQPFKLFVLGSSPSRLTLSDIAEWAVADGRLPRQDLTESKPRLGTKERRLSERLKFEPAFLARDEISCKLFFPSAIFTQFIELFMNSSKGSSQLEPPL